VNAAEPTHIRGINEPLPAGEHVLWQGRPDWRSLARTALHIRTLALYFALMLGWRLTSSLADGKTFGDALLSCAALALLALVALGLIAGFAWLAARTTIYAITTERVVMRVGVAMPIFVNIPFSGIDAAALKAYRDGSGDIPLALKEDVRLAYLHLWPHARPWQMAHPQPMLRALPAASTVASLLAKRLALTTPVTAPRSATPTRGIPARGGVRVAPEDNRVAA
jgi:hypothetical protein